jgi:hypothetical protein
MAIRTLVRNPLNLGVNIEDLISLHHNQNSLLVRHGDYVYNVTSYPEIYYSFSR